MGARRGGAVEGRAILGAALARLLTAVRVEGLVPDDRWLIMADS